jgi:UDP-N-acetylmuramate-alanine ligase
VPARRSASSRAAGGSAPVALPVLGRHNALNAAAAFAAGSLLGFPESDLRSGLERFTGTRRRFEFKGVRRGGPGLRQL